MLSSKRIPAQAAVALLLAFTLPACNAESEAFQFEKEDMEGAVYGTWSGEYALQGGEPEPFTLEISAGEPGLTPTCASRDFTNASDAASGYRPQCTTLSTLYLRGVLQATDAALDEPELEGSFMVSGMELDNGLLSLAGKEGAFSLSAGYSQGSFEDCTIFVEGSQLATCSLERDQ